MEVDMVKYIPSAAEHKRLCALLKWLSGSLQTRFTRLEELSTGSVYCQLMHQLFPESLDLMKVRFRTRSMAASMWNFSLLQSAFRHLGIKRHIPVDSLIKEEMSVSLEFLQWFNFFYNSNCKDPRASQETEDDQKLTSDPDKSESVEEPMETAGGEDGVQGEGETTDQQESFLMAFVRRYCRDSNQDAAERSVLPAIFSTTHPKDIIQACSRTPYCLYLYVGVELEGGRRTSVLLIGYCDRISGRSVLRLLHTLQLRVDAADTEEEERDLGEGQSNADMDADLLVETLQNFLLPLSNLAVLYCDSRAVGCALEARLLRLRPGLLSLCGLPGAAARALQAGLSGALPCVVTLLRDLQCHYSAHHRPSPSCSDNTLAEVFGRLGSFDPKRPAATSCASIMVAAQTLVSGWREVLQYFKSLRGRGAREDVGRITAQLMDHSVKLHFLFLLHAVGPLRDLQELQEGGSVANVPEQLQQTCSLIASHSTFLLEPIVATLFSRKLDASLRLTGPLAMKPEKVADGIGRNAQDFLCATAVVDLSDQDREKFLQSAASFYYNVLETLVQSVPANLSHSSLMVLSKLLKQPTSMKYMRKPQLAKLAAQLHVCQLESEANQLAEDFTVVIKAMVDLQKTKEGGASSWLEMFLCAGVSDTVLTFVLTLLAAPTSLCRSHTFAKMLSSSKDLLSSQKSLEASLHRPSQMSQDSSRIAADGPKQEEEEKLHVIHLPSEGLDGQDSDSSLTDNSSDVIEVTGDRRGWLIKGIFDPPESTYILSDSHSNSGSTSDSDSDDDDTEDGDISADMAYCGAKGVRGELVWALTDGLCHWPGIITECREEEDEEEVEDECKDVTAEWYGQKMSCQVNVDVLKPFAAFTQHFSSSCFATNTTYREAVFLSLQEAAIRCHKRFSEAPENREELLRQMLDWAFAGFQPSGPEGLKPTSLTNGVANNRPKLEEKPLTKEKSSTPSRGRNNVGAASDKSCIPLREVPMAPGQVRGSWNKRKVQRTSHLLMDELDEDTSPDFLPHGKKRHTGRVSHKVAQQPTVYTQPNQKLREKTIRMIVDGNLDIEGFCLCCGTEDVVVSHPLFKGGLCRMCQDNFTETLFRYDEDGYQSYCTICCYGLEVILCGHDSCCRSFCADCLDILVGSGTFGSLKDLDPWICYLCQPHMAHGALLPRHDWSIRVQELFANNSGMEFELHRVYPSIPASQRRPLRVLSLFDGIATGYLVLKDLGFKVEKYMASEVCEDSVAVAMVNSDGRISHIGDVRCITPEHVEKWGPFDLLIGGSPCNDLSIVNPLRKGLYEGTGRLFFDFYRILQLLKPREDDPRPFFWLFENVVFMNRHDKVNICRFLECNPVLVDAVNVSPAHRARCFWGNIPAMSRPIIASQNDKLSLQDCLEVGREARVTKVRTITTNPNSLKQGKDVSLLPVLQNGKEDSLWITELERIFGFPKHYTDVRNMNRQQRQKVLGKSWSVPVIRHLFAPLKDYFACEELPAATTTTTTSTSTPPRCPSSPDLQRL